MRISPSRAPRSARRLPALTLAVTSTMTLGTAWAGPEPEDDHVRPAELEDFSIRPPPPDAAESQYPLAVGFVAASPSNYQVDGMTAFTYVVVHTMQGSYNGTISWFKNPDAQVSTHYVMRSVDGEVTQMVVHKDKAYHVKSSNPVALGIEHEGYVDDPAKWYTWETYVSSARLTRWLTIMHDIPVDRDHVVGHSELPNQTHTDPGGGWNWQMYMDLIHDVVPPGEIHVIAVDRSKACTITATADTYLQRTAEPTELLGAQELCPIAPGTALTYLHASPPIGGRRRLLMEPGQGPCAGVAGLDAEAFIDETKFSALCAMEDTAAVGAQVRLDGGPAQAVGPDGVLLLPPAAAGAHTLEFSGQGYEPAMEAVELAVYPGARVAVALDPVPVEPPEDTTGGEAGESGEAEEGGEAGDPSAGSEGGEDEGVTGAGPTSAGAGEGGGEAGSEAGGDSSGGVGPGPGSGPALPEGYGQYDDAEGCACAAGGERGGLWALWLALPLGLRRRVTRRRR